MSLARALAAACAGALAIGAVVAVNAGSAPSVTPGAAPAAAPRLASPMIPARPRAHRITKTTIGLFTATPAQLPAAGGSVRLVAVVEGATSCRFSSSKPVDPLPASKSCATGTVSIAVKLPKNTRSSSRSFRFLLTASGAHSSTTAGPVWVVESAPSSAHGAPRVTTQPTGRSVPSGGTVSFRAAASGSPRVHWQVSSDGGQHWSTVPGATSPTYSFTATLADSGREFRAVFTNAAGSSHSDPATLNVTSGSSTGAGNAVAEIAPAVTVQPSSQNAASGSGVTFTAAASGSPAPSIQWQVSSDGGGSWASIAGANSASYALTAQLGESGYEYRAVFSNPAGTATTNGAILSVFQGPSITTQPGNQSVVVGSSVTFTAAAAGSPTPGVQWQVSLDGGITWSPVAGATATSYTFTPALGDSGHEYEAVFSNGAGTATSSAATLTVTPTSVAPAVTAQPGNDTVVAGQLAAFSAAASGSPTPSVQWQVSTNFGGTWTQIPGATSTTYAFTASQGEAGYEFEAVFSNGFGTPATTNPATLIVETAPQITVQPMDDINVPAGTSASFSAAATGIPSPSVQWQVSANGGASWTQIPGATSAIYNFTAQLSSSGDEYEAVFSNAAGSATTNPATLTVLASPVGPSITGNPTSVAVVSGTNVSFSASASGSPTPSVQWDVSMNHGGSWSPIAGATSATYSFVASGSENGFEYEAVFTNSVSSATTSAATLVVGADATSTNWSGYFATGTFTAVTGSWSVPAVICSGATTFSSEWVGIDGDPSSTVEQDGTDSDCSGGVPTYYAWYETYGAPNTNPPFAGGAEVALNETVAAGDSMTGTVSYSGSMYTLVITDNTRVWSQSIGPFSWSAPTRSSAEWIAERPQINGSLSSLANFGSVTFSGSTATTSGSPLSISALGGSPLEMTSSSGTSLLALPGSLTPDGEGFTDTFYGSN